jgi:plastocyanin
MIRLALVAVAAAGCGDALTGPDALVDRLPTDLAAAVATADHPLSATVLFGRTDVGSPFPPVEHDASFHAKVKVYPRTVVIAAGGSVTFEMTNNHSVAIYAAGTELDDIDVTDLAGNLIDDGTNRLAFSALSVGPATFTSPPGTFDTPGGYLVICRVLPHFVVAGMYAWVIVK